MFRHLCAFSLFIAVGIVGFSASTFAEEPIDRLLQASGVTESLDELPGLLLGSMTKGLSEREDVSQEDISRLLAVAKPLTETDRVMAVLGAGVSERLAPGDIDELMAWYGTLDGELITAAEVAGGREEVAMEVFANIDHFLSQDAAVRRAMKLEDVVLGVEKVAEVQLTVVRSALYAAAITQEGLGEEERAEIDQGIDVMRLQVIGQMEPLVVASYVNTYAEIDDQLFDRYIEFQSSDAAQRYNNAMVDTLNEVVQTIMIEWADLAVSVLSEP